ncbi:hypothetical protein HGRIS_006852 [Hohenbuehelia grisea]|uniref:Uncharacterized protein n=1 Tax=Hohenbuehelia grisea TaxID=104357 RepID=A0ABR3JAK9_9AGAR
MSTTGRASKKRRHSGCSTTQFNQHLDTMKRLLNTIENGDVDLNEEVRGLVTQLVDKMETQLEGTTPTAFSVGTLAAPEITEGPGLALKPWTERVQDVSSLGSNQFMSSQVFYSLLSSLSSLISTTCKASARSWVDIFLYRVSAMLRPPRRMVLRKEDSTAPTPHPALADQINYTAVIVEEPTTAGVLFDRNDLHNFPGYPRLTIFVVEARGPPMVLHPYIDRAVEQLFATAKALKKTQLRGTITNGFTWIFVIVYLNDTGGGTYSISWPLAFSIAQANELYHVPEMDKMPNLISAVLTYWLERSFEDIEQDDWFTMR